MSAGGVTGAGAGFSAQPIVESVMPAMATSVSSFFMIFLVSLWGNRICNKQDIPAERFRQNTETAGGRIIPVRAGNLRQLPAANEMRE